MKEETKVKRAAEQKLEFDRRIAAKRKKNEEEKDGKKRKIVEELEKQKASDTTGQTSSEKNDTTYSPAEDDEGMKEDEIGGTRGREGDDAEGEAKKRLRMAGVEAKEALERIELWINEVKVQWESAGSEEEQYICDTVARVMIVFQLREVSMSSRNVICRVISIARQNAKDADMSHRHEV